MVFLIAATTVFGFSMEDIFGSPVGKESVKVSEAKNFEAPVKEVTIYSNNMAFVRRVGNFDGKTGIVQINLLNFTQPVQDSLFVYDDKGKIREWYIHDFEKVEEVKDSYTRSFEEILNESIGKEIQVMCSNETITGKLLWVWNEKLGIEKNGGVLFLNLQDMEGMFVPGIDVSKKPENKTVVVPELVIKEISEQGKHNVLLAYLRSGANWNANFKFYLETEGEEGFGTLQSWAFVENNAQEDWSDVKMKLVVGYPNIVSYISPYTTSYNYNRNYAYEKTMDMTIAGAAPAVQESVTQSSVGDYYVYTLDETVSINSSQSRNLPIFSETVKFKRKYLWNANLENAAYKIYEINNTLQVPWAEGVFSVYLGSEFEGQDSIEYTAKEAGVEVKVSKAPDIVVKKETLEKTTEEGYDDPVNYPRTYTTKTYYKVRLTIESHKTSDATMLIKDEMQQGDQVNFITGTIKPEMKLYSLKWNNLKLKNGEKKIIDYEYEVKNSYMR